MSISRLSVEAIATVRLLDDIEPGNTFICKDPHTSNACHQGEIGVIMSVFHNDQPVAWTFANARLMDAGGAAISRFGPQARDIRRPL